MNSKSHAEKGKQGLVESVEEALMRDPADPVELAGFIELITGGSTTSKDFRGQMHALRDAGRADLLWDLGKKLTEVIAELKNTSDVHPQDIELYEASAADALLTYQQVEEFADRPGKIPLVERNQWTESGDRYRKATKIRMHKALGQSDW